MDRWADDPGAIPPANIRQPSGLLILQLAGPLERRAQTTIAVGERSKPKERKQIGLAAERRNVVREFRAELLCRYAARAYADPGASFTAGAL